MTIHTGKLLTAYFEKNRTYRAYLAKLLGISYNSLLHYQKRDSIQTRTLLEISTHTKHNFFMDMALQLPLEYTTTTDPFFEKNQRIAELEAENEALKVKMELLLSLLKK
ncbi:hypothetical protein B0A58_12015 [Flavobacterium branchiophilum NBRC 15030 = ATCC 35035]|uniref:XRE family transcriptional regulator n=1 Tax=Flavobacterium branchiophilum TaxID=55197 RepID=A0A543G4I3_9FLAO|nr:hypothetical protein [Flavobacterium branchiophilum]OXA73169.1 hypothetical protein B0A58_12015 [Flavobacterium branchiophilum NBRC 15030 = ATCC 35035]TQM40957.1 hypothetical protein BC670_1882 [Flavobacterium branchiophilum]GEM54771.1 hypothetical protein FB1_09920 [Flavobacterium branchiophilum NBRC 15030 = ATCC 35035]